MNLQETIENYKKASNTDIHQALTFLKERFDNDKERVIEITHQIDLIERDYHKLYTEYKKRLNING
jgi:hypothetical protein